jgi:hypothetical protein
MSSALAVPRIARDSDVETIVLTSLPVGQPLAVRLGNGKNSKTFEILDEMSGYRYD